MFELHQRLREDCIKIGDFELCTLLMMNDSAYRWFILVPRREGVSEIFHLSAEDQLQLMRESSFLSELLSVHFRADKMNVASIGNVVPQLHVHHVVRFRNDPAWPAPVWGKAQPIPYGDDEKGLLIAELAPLLGEGAVFKPAE